METPAFVRDHLGEVAALGTAVCWSLTPFFFTLASRRVGAFAANVIRLCLACVLLTVTVFAVGAAHPMPLRQAALLAASGFVGLALGDAALFESLVTIGPRRTALLGATAPIFVVLASAPLLGETMTPIALAGMAMTLGGVAWVIAARPDEGEVRGSPVRGVVMGGLAAAGQGIGAILATAGLGEAPAGSWCANLAAGAEGSIHVSPLLGTQTRMLAGCGGMLLYAAVRGHFGEVGRGFRDRPALKLLAGGAVFGPFVGVWLSLIAFANTHPRAVAQTIMALGTIFVILIAWALHRERPTLRMLLGAIVAVAGAAVLALREQIAAALGG